jgi:adenylosuccinate synthase
MRDEGNEYGSTTGRPRRCGWLDLTALNYTIMLNGVTDLVMTKGDVLSAFKTLKISTKYKLDGEFIDHIPFESEQVEAVYDDFAGWNVPVDTISDIGDFPEQLNAYIGLIEKFTNTPITVVSVGPDRKQTILR